MIIGTVNRHLMPIIPVNVRSEGNAWQQLELLLDTGFDGAIALELELVHRLGLETRPIRQLLTSEFVPGRQGSQNLNRPVRVEAELQGSPQEVSLLILEKHLFSSMLGTEMLKFRRVTVDVMEGGPVTVDTFCPDSGRGTGWRLLGNRKRQRPFGEAPEEYGE